jgi:hypothetical protein
MSFYWVAMSINKWDTLEVRSPFGFQSPRHDFKSIGFVEAYSSLELAKEHSPGMQYVKVETTEDLQTEKKPTKGKRVRKTPSVNLPTQETPTTPHEPIL